MQAGLGVLRWTPRAFWAATPRELAAAFDVERVAPLARAELDDLMTRFPDVT